MISLVTRETSRQHAPHQPSNKNNQQTVGAWGKYSVGQKVHFFSSKMVQKSQMNFMPNPISMDFPVAQTVKNMPMIQETRVQSLGWEDPLEKGMASYSSILAWRIPWTEEPVRLQSVGLQRVRHDWVTNTHILILQQSKNPNTNITVGNKSPAALFQAMCLAPTPTCHSCLTSDQGPEQMWAQAENVEYSPVLKGFQHPRCCLDNN